MEQGPCWMWTKRKYSISSSTSPNNPSYDDSWEEQAFAEDAAGALGGCVWPPRSYSCSFCRREFRSAQALGGHMNVHRRDRARLKQPSSPPNEILCHDLETHHHNPSVQNPFPNSLDYLYSSPVCGLAYKTSPNSDHAILASPSSPSPSMALAPLINENFREETRNPSSNFSSLQDHNRTHSPLPSWSNPAEDIFSHKFGIDAEDDIEKNSKKVDSGCKGKGENGKSDVGLSLNLIVCRAHSPVQFETNEATSTLKRRRTDASLVPFFPISSSIDRHDMQREMFGFNPSSVEELDLELRLGHRPKDCDDNDMDRNYRDKSVNFIFLDRMARRWLAGSE